MAERTKEQILDEIVYAVACVARHYGPGLNTNGLRWVREQLSGHAWHTDSCYRVDCYEDDEHVDFHTRIVWPPSWDQLAFEEVKDDSMPYRI